MRMFSIVAAASAMSAPGARCCGTARHDLATRALRTSQPFSSARRRVAVGEDAHGHLVGVDHRGHALPPAVIASKAW